MYWLQRPPYLRRAAAALLIVGAVVWDLRGASTEAHPFASQAIAAGSAITSGNVVWRSLPAGSFAIPDLVDRVAAVDLPAGEPITVSVLAAPATVPEGWWAVPIDIGPHAVPGDEVMLVITDPPVTVGGVVVGAQRGDPYSLDYRPALVAVPAEMAAVVAAASRAGLLVTATRP
ncbi:MAG TPA: SAF domain-containing protein [Acidimicrobiia bacterium]|nr:SAF domain-containing protein [Acidimicrobiia bacterium]